MGISNQTAAIASQLQQTVGMSMLKTANNMQAAGAIMMLQDLTASQKAMQAQAPHPNLGHSIDIQV